MSYTIHDNTVEFERAVDQKTNVFLRMFADKVIEYSTQSTPKKMGNLRQDVIRQILGLAGKIVWGKNYAAYQETKQYSHYTTPGTGPHFAENAVKRAIHEIAAIAARAGLIK